jgi:hypothetical protein
MCISYFVLSGWNKFVGRARQNTYNFEIYYTLYVYFTCLLYMYTKYINLQSIIQSKSESESTFHIHIHPCHNIN